MRRKYWYFLGLFVILSGLFYFRFVNLLNKEKEATDVSGIISDEPVVNGNNQEFSVKNIKVITRRFPEYSYGDFVEIKSKNNKNNGRKNYFYYPQIKVVSRSSGNKILEKIINFRKNIVKVYQEILPEPEAGLLSGIVLGVKSGLPYDFSEDLKNTGVIHVVVASGTNITFVAGFLIFIFQRFFNRKMAIFLSFLGIIFYSLMAGFQPPIVRASIMAIVVLISQMLGRQSMGIVSLLFAVLLMLFINPLYIFDIGFQLSVMATLGLLVIGPVFKRWKFFSIPVLGEDLKTSLSAQIMVLPILFFDFGKFSILSPVVNVLVLWVIPPLMILGFLIAVFGLIFFPIAQFIAYIAYGFLFYFVEVVKFFGKVEWGRILVETPSVFLIIGYYLIIISVLFIMQNKKAKK